MLKRTIDLLVSVSLLILFLPLMLLIAGLVKATSRGPVIFRQECMGYKQAVFTIFKFRTMVHLSGRPFKMVLPGDKRVTKLGKLLRSTHLDELPQLWNVLCGEMSLVGPRPDPLDRSELCLKTNPNYRLRFEVKPGMTGILQIHGRIWALDNPQKAAALEADYIRNRNLRKDLQILVSTALAVIRRQGV